MKTRTVHIETAVDGSKNNTEPWANFEGTPDEIERAAQGLLHEMRQDFSRAAVFVDGKRLRFLSQDKWPTGPEARATYTKKETETAGEKKMNKNEIQSMTLAQLTELYNKHVPKGKRIKKFSDKKSALRRTRAVVDQRVKKDAEKGVTKRKKKGSSKRPAGTTKYGKLREAFMKRKSYTRAELVKISGFDARNVAVAMSILRNKNRTAEPVVTEYDRAAGSYTLIG